MGVCLGMAAASIVPGGCDDGGAGPSHRVARVDRRIAIVGSSNDDPAWDLLRTVAGEVVAKSPGARVTFFAPESDTPAGQQAVLEKVGASDVDSVCLLPGDPMAIQDQVRELTGNGKRVVLVGRDIPGSTRNLFVGPSELEIGRAAAAACHQVLPAGRRTIMLLHAGAEDPVYGIEYAAFKERLRAFPDISLMKEFDCGANGTRAQQIMRRQSRLYPRLGAWVLLDDWPLRHDVDVKALIPSGCSLIVCRDDPRYTKALRAGEIDAIVTYDMFDAAREAVRAALRLGEIRGGEPVDRDIIPAEVITTDDVDWYEKRWELWQKGIASPPRRSE